VAASFQLAGYTAQARWNLATTMGTGKMESCHHEKHKGRRVCDTPALGYGVGRSSVC